MFIKNKLKYLIIFLIGLVIILTLTIILQIPGLKAQPVTLKLLVLEQETNYWQDLIAEFEQHNPNIHINLDNGSNISNELAQIYINDFQSNIPEYDIIYMDIIWVAQFAHNNWLKDLSPFLDKNQTKQLQQAFLANDLTSGYYNDKLYRLPFRSGVRLIYYRQDLLEAIAAQPPKTFDDLISITKTLKNQGLVREGYLWQGREYEGIVTIFMEIIQGYGGFWINENGEVGLNQPPAIKAVKFLRSLIQKEQISPKPGKKP